MHIHILYIHIYIPIHICCSLLGTKTISPNVILFISQLCIHHYCNSVHLPWCWSPFSLSFFFPTIIVFLWVYLLCLFYECSWVYPLWSELNFIMCLWRTLNWSSKGSTLWRLYIIYPGSNCTWNFFLSWPESINRIGKSCPYLTDVILKNFNRTY